MVKALLLCALAYFVLHPVIQFVAQNVVSFRKPKPKK